MFCDKSVTVVMVLIVLFSPTVWKLTGRGQQSSIYLSKDQTGFFMELFFIMLYNDYVDLMHRLILLY